MFTSKLFYYTYKRFTSATVLTKLIRKKSIIKTAVKG